MSNSATEHLGSSGLCHESRDGMQWGPARCCFVVLQVFGCFFTCIERRLWKREARQALVWSQSDDHWSLAHYKASALGSTNSVLELAWCRWARKRDDWMMCIDLWVIVDTILKYLENLDTFSHIFTICVIFCSCSSTSHPSLGLGRKLSVSLVELSVSSWLRNIEARKVLYIMCIYGCVWK